MYLFQKSVQVHSGFRNKATRVKLPLVSEPSLKCLVLRHDNQNVIITVGVPCALAAWTKVMCETNKGTLQAKSLHSPSLVWIDLREISINVTYLKFVC